MRGVGLRLLRLAWLPRRVLLLRKQTQCGALAAEGSGAAGRCSAGSGASSVALPRAAWISSPMSSHRGNTERSPRLVCLPTPHTV